MAKAPLGKLKPGAIGEDLTGTTFDALDERGIASSVLAEGIPLAEFVKLPR